MKTKCCEGCAYNRGLDCSVFKARPQKCWNNTSQEAAAKREEEIKAYAGAVNNALARSAGRNGG